jgi:hypothetical protein
MTKSWSIFPEYIEEMDGFVIEIMRKILVQKD